MLAETIGEKVQPGIVFVQLLGYGSVRDRVD